MMNIADGYDAIGEFFYIIPTGRESRNGAGR